LPDDTPIDRVQFPTRIHKALAAAGLKTIGEIRETSNEKLLDLQDLGSGSVSYLREAVGLPSCDGLGH
jgi:DNA-directed RNA polymerase alpha subunit